EDVSKINQNTIEQKEESTYIGKITEKFDLGIYEKKVDEYKNAVDNTSEYMIALIIVFIFQTILLTIGFIYILYVYIKRNVL
ncbi:hypothetical protein ACOL22_12365, partial [Aliarcobacter butzleri]